MLAFRCLRSLAAGAALALSLLSPLAGYAAGDPVNARPDLVIGAAAVANLAGVDALTATVRNQGAAPAPASTLWVMDRRRTTLIAEAEVPALEVGAAVEVSVPLPAPVAECDWLVARADGPDAIDEVRERPNDRIALAYCLY